LAAILNGTSTNLYAAIGLTVVLIAGQLDLSIGALMTLGGMVVIGLEPKFGWAVGFTIGPCRSYFVKDIP